MNGWLIGRYVNSVGPQHQFYVPAGILNDHGANTLAIAVWGLDAAGGGLDQVSLVAAGDQAGGVPPAQVASPGYSPEVYGPPAAPQPTLAAISSSALAEGTFTVRATLRNPTSQPLSDAAVSMSGTPKGRQRVEEISFARPARFFWKMGTADGRSGESSGLKSNRMFMK